MRKFNGWGMLVLLAAIVAGCDKNDANPPDAAIGDLATLVDAAGDASPGITTTIQPQTGGGAALGNGTGVSVPADAVDQATELTVREVAPSTLATPPTGATTVGQAVAFTPHGQSFKKPVTLTLAYDTAQIKDDAAVLRLDDPQDTSWEEISAVSFANGKATLQTDHFSVFVVVSFKRPSKLVALNTTTNAIAATPTLIAWRDGQGSWQTVDPSVGKASLAIKRATYQVVVVCEGDVATDVAFITATPDELPKLDLPCPQESGASADVSGTISGLLAGERFWVTIGPGGAWGLNGETTYKKKFLVGTFDASARRQESVAPFKSTQILIERNINVPAGGRSWDVDFGSAPTTTMHSLAVGNTQSAAGDPWVELWTAGHTWLMLGGGNQFWLPGQTQLKPSDVLVLRYQAGFEKNSQIEVLATEAPGKNIASTMPMRYQGGAVKPLSTSGATHQVSWTKTADAKLYLANLMMVYQKPSWRVAVTPQAAGTQPALEIVELGGVSGWKTSYALKSTIDSLTQVGVMQASATAAANVGASELKRLAILTYISKQRPIGVTPFVAGLSFFENMFGIVAGQ